MEELEQQTRESLGGQPITTNIFPFQYAFNVFSHNSPMLDNGYNEEEMKMVRPLPPDKALGCPLSSARAHAPPWEGRSPLTATRTRFPPWLHCNWLPALARLEGVPHPPAHPHPPPTTAGQGDAQDPERRRHPGERHLHPRARHARARGEHQPGV